MDEEGTAVNGASPAINTYHCICSTLVLASTFSLESLTTRAPPAQDRALILPLPPTDEQLQVNTNNHSILLNTTEDRKPLVVRREDGFEKRTLVRCGRCNLPIGYKLDESQFTEPTVKASEVIYLLPGGLANTADMKLGKVADVPEWATERS